LKSGKIIDVLENNSSVVFSLCTHKNVDIDNEVKMGFKSASQDISEDLCILEQKGFW
jgi:hypothetical protein